MRKKIVFIAALTMLMATVAQAADAPPIVRDIVYGEADGVKLMLDMAKPMSGAGPFPAVVCVHGGGWQAGARHDMEFMLPPLAEAGYLAVTIEYRLAPKYKWPAQIEDAKCAVRYVRAHAKELNVNPDRIFATGASAGGHLVLLLGLMDAKDGLEGTGGNPGVSSKVQAVANFFGPADFRTWKMAGEDDKTKSAPIPGGSVKMLETWLGTSDRASATVNQASPVTYIDAGDSPVLSFYGTKDQLVPFEQAEQLHKALSKAGLKEKLVPMKGEGHGWGGEKMTESIKQLIAFFNAAPSAKR